MGSVVSYWSDFECVYDRLSWVSVVGSALGLGGFPILLWSVIDAVGSLSFNFAGSVVGHDKNVAVAYVSVCVGPGPAEAGVVMFSF